MSAALHGKLQDFGIAEVFQLIGQQRKTGVLDVRRGKETLRLAFDQGCVVWARPVGATDDAAIGERMVRCGLLTRERLVQLQSAAQKSARPIGQLAADHGEVRSEDVLAIEELVTNDTVFQVLRWSNGSFDFSAQPVRHDLPPERLLHAEQILMDGLRMVDEWGTFAPLVPDGDTVFERAAPIANYKRSVSGESKRRLPSVEKVFSLVDGRLPAQRIIDLSRLGLFDATRALAELHHHDVIRPLSKRASRARRRASEGRRPVVESVRGPLAAAFPLALLATMVSMILNAAPATQTAAVFPITREPLEDARSVYQKRRALHALEAQHLLTGAWPERLDAPEPTGLLEGESLAPDGAAPYYYERRGDGIILLAPGR